MRWLTGQESPISDRKISTRAMALCLPSLSGASLCDLLRPPVDASAVPRGNEACPGCLTCVSVSECVCEDRVAGRAPVLARCGAGFQAPERGALGHVATWLSTALIPPVLGGAEFV